MRLGAYECVLQKGSKAYLAYGEEHIQERHRHRYEFKDISQRSGEPITHVFFLDAYKTWWEDGVSQS